MTENPESSAESSGSEAGIRQNLIDTAVNFLVNREVLSKPEQSKISFLKKKGLTDVEISLAFEKAKWDPRYASSNIALPPPLPYRSQPSIWSRLHQFSSSFIILAIALYGLHQFYKLYIEPWLFGSKCEKNQLKQMEEQLLELNKSILQLSQTVTALEKSINSHKDQIDKVIEANGFVSTSVALSSLKNEIAAVKSILINRHQFPAVPKVGSPSIPHWQLPSNENEKVEDEGKTEIKAANCENEQTSKATTDNDQLQDIHSSKAPEDKIVENSSGKNGRQFSSDSEVGYPSIPHWQLPSNENEKAEDEAKIELKADNSGNEQSKKTILNNGQASILYSPKISEDKSTKDAENSSLKNGSTLPETEEHENAKDL